MPLLNPPSSSAALKRRPALPNLPDPSAARDERTLRIALVTEYYYPHLGGVCEHVHFFAREARRRGHHVDIITSNIAGRRAAAERHPARPQPAGVRERLPGAHHHRLRASQADAAGAARGHYDIVHVHSPLTPVLPILAIEEADCPVVGTFHTYFDKSKGYHLFNSAFSRSGWTC